MPMIASIQNNFNAGEFSPLAYGRSDFKKYANGLAQMQRYVALIQGPATRTPGFLHKKESKAKGKVRMMPFIFSNGDAFMIEIGDLYMRFYQNREPVKLASQAITAITKANPAVVTYAGADTYSNGDEVYLSTIVGMVELNGRWCKVANLNAGANTFELHDLDGNNINSTSYTAYSSGGTVEEVYEIVSPYALADIFDIRFFDSGDVVYLAHPDYAPRKLARSAATSWTFSNVSFKDGPYLDINSGDTVVALSATVGGTSVSIVANSIVGINTDTGFQSTDVGRLFRWKNKDGSWTWLTITAYVSTTKVTATISGTVPATTAKNISGITKANPGVVTAVAHGLSNGDSLYMSDVLGMTQVNNLFFTAAGVTANTFQLSGVNTTGYSTYTSGGHVIIVANKITNITAASPAVVTAAAHNFAVGDIVYIDGVLGMTQINAGFYTVTATTVNTYTLALDSSAFTAYGSGGAGTLASAFWRVGEWSATTGYPSVLFSFEDRLGWAASTIAPQTMNLSKTGDYENMAPTNSGGVVTAENALQLRLNSGAQDPIRWVKGDELGLLVGTGGGEWVIRSSTTGEAISALNLPSARQSTGHGSAASIEPVRIGKALLFVQTALRKLREMAYVFQFDGFSAPDVTLLAEHITKTGIKGIAYQKEPYSILWAFRTDGRLVGVTYDKDQEVLAWHGHPLGGYSDAGKTAEPIVESAACLPSPDGGQDDLWISAKFYTNGQTRRFIGYLSDFNTAFDDVSDCYFVDFGVQGTLSSPGTIIRGLDHLEGETVSILADGSPRTAQVVSGGKVTLTANTTKYSVGLGFISRLKTLRPDVGAANGTALGKLKRIHKLYALFHESVGLKAGEDFDTMQAFNFRENSDPMSAAVPLFSGIKKLDYDTDYNQDGQICLEQSQPLPSTILAISPHITTQDAQ